MKLFPISILFVLLSVVAQAQLVTIIDKTTQQTIPGVSVYSLNPIKTIISNSKGQFNMAEFAFSDSIYFKILGYLPKAIAKSEIESMKFKILLTENPINLGEVIVSSSRWSESKMDTPNRIEKINMKEVAFQNPQTTADLLGTSGYVFIQKSQLGGGSPMLRGMATSRVLMVIDGIRMNNAIFRAGNVQNVISLDANALESTEILFSPGCVMYGSDAIGGVMDFRTLSPKYADSTNKFISSGNALMRMSSANSERTGHLDVKIGTKKLAFVTSFTQADYGDLRSGSADSVTFASKRINRFPFFALYTKPTPGVHSFYRTKYVQTIDNKDYEVKNEDSTLQVGSKYSQINFMQKIGFKPNKYWDIDYAFHYSETSKYNRYDRLYVIQTQGGPYKNKMRWAEWYYGPQKWNMHRIGIIHTKPNIIYDQVRAIGALQYFEESRYDREFGFRQKRMQKETVDALSLNLDFDKKIGKKLDVFYGVETIKNTVGSEATFTHTLTKKVDSTVTRYPNGSTWESNGAYVNLKYKLTKKLVFNAGARYSNYLIKAKFDTTFFPFPFTETKMKNDAFNGCFGFVFNPKENWQVYLNGSSGYRAPNIDDMGKVFESTPGYLVVPNPNLKPETVYNLEIGSVKTFWSFLRLDFAAYYTWLEDAMVRKNFEFNGQTTIKYYGNSSIVQAIQNVTKIYVYGTQAGLEFMYKGVGLKSTFSYQKGEEQSPDSLVYYPLRHAAPWFGSTHLTYQTKKIKLDFYSFYNGRMNYEDLALTERVATSYAKDSLGFNYCASWYTLNFKAAYFVNEFVMISAGIENILDILYRPYSSGINAPGRNIIASIRARF
ncbi:MAG TPA: TonB-dependent receptor [Bacteroidia bacterium]|nr:TonB-dependent receptor [Bacteroidia bacterium]